MILPIGNKKGFSLIELMLSILIISVGLVAVIQAFTTILNSLGVSRSNIKGVMLLEQKMEDLEESSRTEEEGLKKGIISEDFIDDKDYNWTSTISEKNNEAELDRLNLTVEWKKGRRNGSISLITYLISDRKEENEKE